MNQPGVPVVDVTLRCDASPQLAVTSERFFTDPAMAKVVRTRPSWETPLCTKTPGATSGLSGRRTAGNGSGRGRVVPALGVRERRRQWIFPHRVLARDAPRDRARHRSVVLRAGAARRLSATNGRWYAPGRHSVADYLTLAAGFGREHANGVLAEVSSRLLFVRDYLTSGDTRQKYERFMQSLFGPLYRELGLNASPGDDDDKRALRATVIQTLDLGGNDAALASDARRALETCAVGRDGDGSVGGQGDRQRGGPSRRSGAVDANY